MALFQDKIFKNKTILYALYGGLFGLMFPIIGTLISCMLDYDRVSFSNLIKAQQANPLLWIIDSAPVFLGWFASFGGRQLNRIYLKNHKLEQQFNDMKKLRKMADAANQAKGDFLANMSHEIRTPMNAIIGLSNLALKNEQNPVQHDRLLKIHSSSQLLLRIINDILDFSKIEAGELGIEVKEFQLEQTINDLIGLLNVKLKSKKEIEFVLQYDTAIPKTIKGDPLRVRQILLNLLDNAIKFTPQGEVKLCCTMQSANDNRINIAFEVIDQGIGISPEQLKKLFKPFHQADVSTTRKYGGTGLGLVITQQLVQLMQGKLQVSTDAGKGSKFYFDLAFESVSDISPQQEEKKSLKDLRVLLVDDSETARTILTSMLKSFQFEVLEAADAAEGIALYKKAWDSGRPVSLIIADWYMPEMDGLQMIEELKRESHSIPSVLMVTAYGAEYISKATEENIINGYLVKPVSPSILFDAILNVLHKNNFIGVANPPNSNKMEYYRSMLSGFNVLLVEDNELNIMLAAELLKEAGIHTTKASNGLEATKMVQDQKFDGILMDIQMPVLDGLAATREIRKIKHLQQLPIIAMTAHAMKGEREKSLAAGMQEHITKPIDPDTLYHILIHQLNPQKQLRLTATEVYQQETNAVSVAADMLSKSINTAEGLQRAGGNRKLYQKLLEGFLHTYADAAAQLQKLSAENNTVALARELHGLAGVAGNIGAGALYAEAISLSRVLEKQPDYSAAATAEQLAVIIEQLEQIISDLSKGFVADSAVIHNSKKILTAADTQEAVKILTGMIKENDAEALVFIEQLLSQNNFSEETELRLKNVMQHLDRFDFDAALKNI